MTKQQLWLSPYWQRASLISGLFILSLRYKCLRWDLKAACGPSQAAHICNLRIREVEVDHRLASKRKRKKSSFTFLVFLL